MGSQCVHLFTKSVACGNRMKLCDGNCFRFIASLPLYSQTHTSSRLPHPPSLRFQRSCVMCMQRAHRSVYGLSYQLLDSRLDGFSTCTSGLVYSAHSFFKLLCIGSVCTHGNKQEWNCFYRSFRFGAKRFACALRAFFCLQLIMWITCWNDFASVALNEINPKNSTNSIVLLLLLSEVHCNGQCVFSLHPVFHLF